MLLIGFSLICKLLKLTVELIEALQKAKGAFVRLVVHAHPSEVFKGAAFLDLGLNQSAEILHIFYVLLLLLRAHGFVSNFRQIAF